MIGDQKINVHAAIEFGPVARAGARGMMTSLYLRDPHRNPVEVARYD